MREEIIRKIEKERFIAIVRGYYGGDCLKLAEALHKGGVHLMEVTFNQSSETERQMTAETIRRLTETFGGDMAFGAGTVTSPEMVRQAKEAGAQFIISPDCNEAVIKETLAAGLVSIPGALTPTEIKRAYDLGADFVKVFPASVFGPRYFKEVLAPLNQVKLLAVGGVNTENAAEYMKNGACGAGVASSLFTGDQVKNGRWDEITAQAKAFIEAVR